MDDEKVFINQALKQFGISRTTLYSYLKKLNIKPQKSGNRSYFTNTQIQQISDFIEKNRTPEQQTPNTDEQPNNSQYQEKAIEQLRTELKEERQKTADLTLQLGQWQGRAKTLEEQNVKLLESQSNTIEVSEKSGFFTKIFQKFKK